MFSQWEALGKRLYAYFKAYGGVCGILGSPLFIIAFAITALNYSQWTIDKWTERSESLIPSLLGFSLGTYAIIFSLVGARLKGALRKVSFKGDISFLHAMNATFFHFIFVQMLALMWAFLYQGTWLIDFITWIAPDNQTGMKIFKTLQLTGSFLGYLLLVYSVTLVFAAGQIVYRLALLKDPAED